MKTRTHTSTTIDVCQLVECNEEEAKYVDMRGEPVEILTGAHKKREDEQRREDDEATVSCGR